ncbi:MAG: signal peptidase I [Bacteroidota bacterium]
MWRKVKDVLFIFCFTLFFAAGLKSCIIDAYKIPSESMNTTLRIGDYLLVNKFIYGARTPQKFFYISLPQFQFPKLKEVQRGDVIVFDFPGEPNEVFPVRNLFLVKRCLGLPGDTIDIVNGSVRVNGMRMNYFDHAKTDFPSVVVPHQGMPIGLNAKNFLKWKVFIQREGGSIELRDGKIFIDQQETSSYAVKNNYYFALGDNINNSSDSRAWGFIPEENIVGKAMLIYWSKNSDGIQWGRIGNIIR